MRKTSRTARCLSLAAASFAVSVAPARAHRPYEQLDRTMSDAHGRQLQLVRYYEDGIIGADPVKLMLRDASGTVLAETDFSRDVLVHCQADNVCLAFQYDPPFRVLPTAVLRVSESGFAVHRPSRFQLAIAAVLPPTKHWFDFLFSAGALAAVPLVAQFLPRRGRWWLVATAWSLFVPCAALWLFVFYLGIGLNTLVSVWWTLPMAAALAVLPAVARAVLRSGLTRP
jgi:hypothetical protein